ncbi:hypothetical protein [Halobacterium yunchengense]|uniref:hypothetical protein n=1 Tax=Halobacterium yunchengense TaxID=3108497 RepID=UPI003008F793
MDRDRTVLVAGLGGVGYEALQVLAGDPGIDDVVATDVLADVGETRTNAAIYRAHYRGRNPDVRFAELDLLDVDATTELLEAVEPDVVLTAATLLRYAPFEKLPTDRRDRLIGFSPNGPGYACIVPGQIPLAYNVMQAIEAADVREPHVVNVSMPDVVNPALAAAGHAPLVGAGNVGLVVPAVERAASERYDVPPSGVDAYVVASHASVHPMLFYGDTGDRPFSAVVSVDGTDVTDDFDVAASFEAGRLPFPDEPSAREISVLTGTHAAKIVQAVLHDSGAVLHAPGPNGLPGGYPVRLRRDGASVVLPEGVERAEAEALNRRGLRYDGVERVGDDGAVVFTDEARDAMDDVLGVDVKRFTPAEALAVTADVIEGYRDAARDSGVEPELEVSW